MARPGRNHPSEVVETGSGQGFCGVTTCSQGAGQGSLGLECLTLAWCVSP
jgi:hypothetical protein